MDFTAVRDRLAKVRDEVAQIQTAQGLDQRVRIIAVTKGHSVEAVRVADKVGLDHVGENRVQEGLGKQAEWPEAAMTWHLIGHLQKNKAKFVPGNFSFVHSVDSVGLAHALSGAWSRVNAGSSRSEDPIKVLVQVNVAGETQKSGCRPDESVELVGSIRALDGLDVVGLMTMAPLTDDVSVRRDVFGKLRALRDDLQRQGLSTPELSMGMSGDFREAVAEGATILRLGTVLFGERRP